MVARLRHRHAARGKAHAVPAVAVATVHVTADAAYPLDPIRQLVPRRPAQGDLVPTETEAEPSRSPAVRGALAALLVVVLVSAVAVVTLTGRHGTLAGRNVSRQLAAEQATLRMVPAVGSEGAATCTDPLGRQEWRVTWRAISAPAATAIPTASLSKAEMAAGAVIAHAAGAAEPRAAGTPDAVPTPTVPATSAPKAGTPTAGTPAGPTASATADLGAELADRAGTVALIPTGFAVRPLPAPALKNPTAVPTAATGAGAATTGPTPPSGWQSRDAEQWVVRWSPTVAETLASGQDEKWSRTGPLATLAAIPLTVRQDPRFVTPDGACSVYLAPFVAGTAGTRNAVAVIGDSLVAQLYASEDGTATGAGWLMNRLTAAGDRVEIAGQGGRRWTIRPNRDSGLAEADASMLDEIRGLREARSVVIALGTNDAGWVALASSQEEYELRLAWVLMHLAPILDELRDKGHCTVVTTMAQENKRYIDSAPGRFDAAAGRINEYLRQRAAADPNDRLRLWDWAASADNHGTDDPQPWFGSDTIHLNQAGHGRYADELASAAALC
jgi:lysophospholipase L1-like esterase